MTEEPKKLEVEVTRIDWETGEVTLKLDPTAQAAYTATAALGGTDWDWLQCGWRYLIEPKP